MSDNDIIIALATPWGKSAIAVIRLSGTDSITTFAPLFSNSTKLLNAPSHSLVVGTIVDPESSQPIDQVVVAVYRSPHSYTTEDLLEISCHGSTISIRKILAVCQRHGIRLAEPGEFTYRALRAGKIDLTQAEAVDEIINAYSTKAHTDAFRRLSGVTRNSLNKEVENIKALIAGVNIQLDYPLEESGSIDFDIKRLNQVINSLMVIENSYQYGSYAQEGVRMVITGKVNAGKSSLFNLLLGEERALVASVPGTTRDWLEGTIELAGIPVRVYDTAGLRTQSENVEQRGIERGIELAQNAHIQLNLIDATTIESIKSDAPVTHSYAPNSKGVSSSGSQALSIEVYNKVDIMSPELRGRLPKDALLISATQRIGIEPLLQHLTQVIAHRWTDANSLPDSLAKGSDYAPIVSERQRVLIHNAVVSLQRVAQEYPETSADMLVLDLQDALHSLAEITGEVTTEDILKTMFSNFCVGK